MPKEKVSIEPVFASVAKPVVKPAPSTDVSSQNVVKKIIRTTPDGKKVIVKKIIKKVAKAPVVSAPVVEETVKLEDFSKREAARHEVKSEYLDKSVPLERNNLRIYGASMAFGVIIILVTFGVFVARGNVAESQNSVQEQVQVQDEVEEVEVASVEEVIEEAPEIIVLEKGDITLEILNGSGIAGLAGSAGDEFESLGYVVDSVGNADVQEESELIISSLHSEEELESLIDDVERRLSIKLTGSSSEITTTARIILGSDQN